MSDSLTPRERVLLMTLMAVNEEVPNPVLRQRTGLEVDRKARERLTTLGLLTSAKRGRSIWYELTDAGWAWCGKELSQPAPPRSDTGTRGLYAVLARLHRHLVRADLRLSDLFGETADAAGAEQDGQHGREGQLGREGRHGQEGQDDPAGRPSLAERIRAAYWELAEEPGDWVSLTPVRDRLGDAARVEVDAALRQLVREPDVHLVPETAQFDLTPADRAAAVRIGGKDKHLLKVDQP